MIRLILVMLLLVSLAPVGDHIGVAFSSPAPQAVGSPALAAELPKPPAAAVKLGVAPAAQCGPDFGVYEEVWDVNPETQAAFAYYGKVARGDDGGPSFEPPVVARVVDDLGRDTFYSVEDGQLVKRAAEDFAKRFDNNWCGVIR